MFRPDPFQLLFPEMPIPAVGRSAFAHKISHHVSLAEGDHRDLAAILGRNVRSVRGRDSILEESARPAEISIMLEGWACRYKKLGAGRRQIVAIYLPGDVCDFDVFLTAGLDQSIRATRGASLAGLGQATLDHIARHMPAIGRGFWWESLAASSIQRAWTVNVARRSAAKRLAHLLCELFTRLTAVGLNEDWRCALPLTQTDLGQACGLTSVHTNRTIQELRMLGLIALDEGMLEILDWEAIQLLADFDPDYLQLRPCPVPARDRRYSQLLPQLHSLFMSPAASAGQFADRDQQS